MANIIDAFLITLGLDSAEFDKGKESVKRGQEEIRESANKTADYMKEKGHESADFFKELITGAGSFLGMMVSFSKVHEFIENTEKSDLAMSRLAKNVGKTVGELSAYANATRLVGGTNEGFISSVKSLSGMLVDVEKNLPRAKRAVTVLSAAGVKGLALGKKSDLLDVMDQLATKMQTMSGMEAIRMGERIGIDPGLIRLWRTGAEEMQHLKDEAQALTTTTEEDAEAAQHSFMVHNKLALAQEGIGRVIMRVVHPALEWFSEKLLQMTVWINQHGNVVRIAFMGIAAAMLVLGVNAAIAAVGVLGVTWPLLLIASAVGLVAAGVAWLWEEWKKWTGGGESSLGKLFAFIKAGWDLVQNLVFTAFNAMKQTISDWIDGVMAYFQLLWAIITLDGPGIAKAWDKMTAALGKIIKRLLNYIAYELGYFLGIMLNAWSKAWDAMKEKSRETLQSIGEWIRNMNPAVRAVLNVATGGAINTFAANSVPSSANALRPSVIGGSTTTGGSRSLQIGEVNIHTQATDATGLAASIAPALRNSSLVTQADMGM